MRHLIEAIIRWIKSFFKEKFHQEHPDFAYYFTIVVSFVLFVVSLNVFIELTEELKEDQLTAFDNALTTFIQSYQTPALTAILSFITHLGDRFAYIFFTLAVAAFFYFRYGVWNFAFQSVLVLLLSSLSNIVLKRVINRERPTLEHLVAVNTLSYPSGHSMSAMAFYGFLMYLSFRFSTSFWFKTASFFILGLLILLIGISRIYLGVHFPSDVLGGYVGGLIWVTFCAVLFNIIALYRKKD